ncbi:hypothetical protein [Streptomyces sp. NBC_01446]|uniref:hypothetical protein n=1 Tax=Streptomyces sp. NBC_01446 TaxID=2903870 RepID=UPI00225569AC|nr:hypothetical protein [Streptomyces sp. NBC_01446]MCX4650235.1 hypothetical protein [Streptomyces sp. NBC_01446]
MFGAVDFTDPHILLPAVADALVPGGLFVFSTLGHFHNGQPAGNDVRPTTISVRQADGTPVHHLDMGPRHLQMALAPRELPSCLKIGRPLLSTTAPMHRLSGPLTRLSGRPQPEHLTQHPLLRHTQVVPALRLLARPPAQVVPGHDNRTRLRHKRPTASHMKPGQVETALPVHRPLRTPRRINLLELLAPLVKCRFSVSSRMPLAWHHRIPWACLLTW